MLMSPGQERDTSDTHREVSGRSSLPSNLDGLDNSKPMILGGDWVRNGGSRTAFVRDRYRDSQCV